MTNNKWDWVDEREKTISEEQNKNFFKIVEGTQQFVLLTHFAPLKQVWVPSEKKYRAPVEGDTNVIIKGVCYVLQDGVIKQATFPYTVVKEVRALNEQEDWEFTIPFPHTFTLKAIGAGTKEVEYTLTPSPKKIEITKEILEELAKKPTPEEVVERRWAKKEESSSYPTPEAEGIDPADIPF